MPRHILIKLSKIKYKQKILKAAREILEMEKKPIDERKYISKNHNVWILFEFRFKQIGTKL